MNYTVQIKTSAQAARQLRDHLDDLDHEELWGIYLTGCGYLINAEMLTKGTQTDHIRKACNLMDIALVDHLILTRDVYFSFNDEATKNYQLIKNQ